jgi:DNA-directed RNA polymerase subunit F
MTTTQLQIAELFERLPPAEQRRVAAELYQRAALCGAAHVDLTPEQQADLAVAIAQADRGEVLSSDDVKASMRTRFGFESP